MALQKISKHVVQDDTLTGDQISNTLNVDTIEPQSGTSLTIGASGDTITVPTGASLTVPNGGLSGQNYPAFQASLSANQVISDSVSTIVQFNTVLYDTNSDYNNSTYKYTPTISGKYYAYTRIRGVAGGGNFRSIQIRMYYGGGIKNEAKTAYTVNEITESTLTASSIIDVDASLSQNIRVLVSIDVIGGEADADLVGGDKNQCVFGAFRIGD